MYGFLAGFSFAESIFAEKYTGQKAVHWTHLTDEVTIDVKKIRFWKKLT